MANEESRRFFSLLLENLQVLCKTHLSYSSSVELSGYVCLEVDDCKKERYFLSELINKSGPVASASCCTQIVNKSCVKSEDLNTNRVEVLTSGSNFKSLNDGSTNRVEVLTSGSNVKSLNDGATTNRVEVLTSGSTYKSLNDGGTSSVVEIVEVQMENQNQNMSEKLVQCDKEIGCEGSNHQVIVNTPETCIILENPQSVDVERTQGTKSVPGSDSRFCSESVTYVPEKLEPESHERSGLERQAEVTEMSQAQNCGHVKEEMVESNLIEMAPSTYQTDQVKQLKERIQAISNAKMAVPWLGTPLIQSIRNSVERVEMQQKQTKSQSATQTKSDLVVDCSGEMFPPHSVYGQPMFPTTHVNMAASFQGMNSLNFLPNGVRLASDCLTEQVDELVSQSVDITQMSNFGTGYAYNVLNSPAKRPKSKREGPTYRVKQNWKYAVRQFENFLVHKGMEVVPIYTFPPAQLDCLLCEFILWVKKNNGEDFHPWSVKNFFYHLECHLKEYGYGSSITKGPEFKRSRDVLKQKVNDLETKLHEQSQVLKNFQGK